MKKIIMVTLLGLAITGCGSSSGSSFTGGSGGSTPTTSSPINLGTVSTIPIGISESSVNVTSKNAITSGSVKQLTSRTSVKADSSGNSGSITYITIVNNTNKTANLTNIKVTGDSSVEKNPSWYIDTSACTKVIAQGTCNIKLNPPAANGSFVLTVNYDIGSYSQMISYEKDIPAADGFIYKVNNDLIVTKSVADRSAFSIPIVLSEDLSSLKVQSNRPGFVNTQVVCNGGTSGQNNLCTIMGIVQPGTPAGVASVALSGISAKSGEVVSVTLPLMVVNQTAANLVTTGANVIINPLIANESIQTVTILNNGNAAATGIAFSANNPAIQLGGASSCTSLSAGSSCNITVTSNESQNFQGAVTVNFSGGVVNSTSFSVTYIASTLSPGLNLVTGGNLLYTVLGESSNYSINVINIGGAPLFNVNPLNVSNINPQLSYSATGVSSPACALNGTQSLASGQNCILQIQYAPTSIESASFNYTVTSSYLDNLGESLSYMPVTTPIQYSSIGSPANLSSNPTTWSFAIRADGRESAIESFVISNSGKISTTINSISIPSPLSLTTGANQCGQGTTLQGESANTCNIYVQYGPRTANESNSVNLSIGYAPKPGDSDTTLSIPISYSASTAALIDVVSITSAVNGASEVVTGTGASNSPYTFYNTPTNQLTTTITYQNVGTESAQFFNLNLYNIQNAVAVNPASTCGTGAGSSSLAVGSSCTLILNTVNTNIYNYLNTSGAVNQPIPGYSYIDNATGLNSVSAPFYNAIAGSNIYMTVNQFASVSSNNPSIPSVASSNANFNATFTLSGGDANSLPVTVALQGLGGGIFGSTTSCQISAVGGTCNVPLTVLIGIPSGQYTFQYLVTPNGSTSGYTQKMAITVN